MVKIELTGGVAIGDRTCGYVFGHPNFADGTHVVTSPVVDVDDRFFITHSGTQYEIIYDETPN